ncbi:murein hydrolase activator EnvC family protein [Cellulosimicrobium marinum]|uniref:murein hydrolase activator EnvC family protein n=1 Tax=Cellulosimicrobium marinum TaxID=1638992 RepID=UPI001E35A353|nr:M23 family metallopeptidase [Cellulosimicrobium marinum]MCB7137689.1 M23 family metallopeptidase [Cellulosimicrobium marinum]
MPTPLPTAPPEAVARRADGRRPAAAVLTLALLLLVGAPYPADARQEPPVTVRSAAPDGAWLPPLDRPAGALGVVAPFDAPAQDWLPGHRGVDLAAAPGERVRSPAAGVVTFAGPVAGRDVVVVLHDGGLRTSLEPVTGTVRPGTRVDRGAPVGTVQAPPGTPTSSAHGGHCAGVCVHWGVRRGERYLDPLGLLGDRPPIVLLPL